MNESQKALLEGHVQEMEDDLNKEEELIIEHIKEWVYNDERIMNYINRRVGQYWPDESGASSKEPSTPFQEEFTCQVQVQLVMGLLAKVMVS